jgi:hypothetical protein
MTLIVVVKYLNSKVGSITLKRFIGSKVKYHNDEY